MTGGGRKGSRGFPTAPLEKHIPIQRALNTNHIYKSTVSACFSRIKIAKFGCEYVVVALCVCVRRCFCPVATLCARKCSCGVCPRCFAALMRGKNSIRGLFGRFVVNFGRKGRRSIALNCDEIVAKVWFTVLRSEFSKNCFIFVNHIGHKVPQAQ